MRSRFRRALELDAYLINGAAVFRWQCFGPDVVRIDLRVAKQIPSAERDVGGPFRRMNLRGTTQMLKSLRIIAVVGLAALWPAAVASAQFGFGISVGGGHYHDHDSHYDPWTKDIRWF